MRRTAPTIPLLVPILTAFLLLLSCGDSTAPEETPRVSMPGAIDLGPIPDVATEDLTVTFGANSARPDSAGGFSIDGHQGIPGLAVAVDGDPERPVLFSVVANPQEAQAISLDLHSTALSMVFMTPYVITADPAQAATTLAQIEALPEFEDFEDYWTTMMSGGADALLTEDETADSLFIRAVAAYIVEYVPDVVELSASPRPDRFAGPAREAAPAAQGIVIDPSFSKGGLKVTYEGGDRFKMTNDLGRWAYVKSPGGDFFSPPIGDLIDILKFDRPFSSSETSFKLALGIGDTVRVGAYGYGWHPAEDNRWENLTSQEQEWAELGGYTTVTLEFLPAALSVILNLRSGFDVTKPAPQDIVSFLGSFTGSQALSGKIGERILAADPLGVSWILFKAFLAEFASNPDFRVKAAAFFGIELSEAAISTLASYVALPLKVAGTLDAATAAGKTVLGFRNGRFKTVFTIYREATAGDYGNVTGAVFASGLGAPIAGATVVLEGDEDNPLDPRLTDVTNENGAYTFENITAGAKTIRASKEGYDGAAVTVTVVGGGTVEAPNMTLSPVSGSVTGRILNDILERNHINDGLFQGDVPLFVNEIGGAHRTFFRTASEGTFNIGVPPGTFWIVAAHEDYSRDSVQVTVGVDQTVAAPRDLLLFPQSFMTGTIKLDLNNDGVYETTNSYSATFTSASKLITNEPCPSGASRPFIRIAAATTQRQLLLTIAPALVDGPGLYDLGAFADVSCAGSLSGAGLYHLDTGIQCTTIPIPVNFVYTAFAPETEGCNCGITDPGEVLFDRFGSDLTDVIEGSIFSGTLPGWMGCGCSCDDEDNDGNYECVVDCARAQIRVDFKVIVGSAPF